MSDNPTELPVTKVEIINHQKPLDPEQAYYELIDNLNHPDEPITEEDIKSFEEEKNA